MSETPQKPDDFQKPIPFISPAIQNIFKDDTFLEECIAFSYYKPIPPVERIISDKPTRHIQFQFRDLNAFLNPSKFYVILKYHCEKGDGNALTKADLTTALNPLSHCAIESYRSVSHFG